MYLKNGLCCCFTGHRPEKLKCSEKEIKNKLESAIDNAIGNGYTHFITGMARGVDIWAAEIVVERKKHYDLNLICAIPHPEFDKYRNEYEKGQYNRIIGQADSVLILSTHYSRYCYQKRNKFMVDNSELVIAAFGGENGGTKNTIDYAKRKKIKIINIM